MAPMPCKRNLEAFPYEAFHVAAQSVYRYASGHKVVISEGVDVEILGCNICIFTKETELVPTLHIKADISSMNT